MTDRRERNDRWIGGVVGVGVVVVLGGLFAGRVAAAGKEGVTRPAAARVQIPARPLFRSPCQPPVWVPGPPPWSGGPVWVPGPPPWTKAAAAAVAVPRAAVRKGGK